MLHFYEPASKDVPRLLNSIVRNQPRHLTGSFLKRILYQNKLRRGIMQTLHAIAQSILQILSNPALSGIGSICSLIGIPLAFLLARQSPSSHSQIPLSTSYRNHTERSASTAETRKFIRDGYHRLTLIDFDGVSPTNLDRVFSLQIKKIPKE